MTTLPTQNIVFFGQFQIDCGIIVENIEKYMLKKQAGVVLKKDGYQALPRRKILDQSVR